MGFLSKLAAKINGAPTNQNQTETDTQMHENKTNVIETTQEKNIKEEETRNKISDNHQEDIPTTQKSEKKALYSESLSEQRYAWNKYLSSILAAIETDKLSNLRHFTIYIRKIAGCRYQWNDDAFKRELLSALEPYDCASHIGSSTLSVEIVLDKAFQNIADKKIDETQYKQQFDDIILFGSKKETDEQKFATAIDKRSFVIKKFLKKLRSSTGTDSRLMENLVIIAVRDEEDNDMARYDWVGKRFEDDLKRELTNAFLDKVGSKSLQIVLGSKPETDECICLIENHVYYKWGEVDNSTSDNTPEELPYEHIVATLSILEGTGSMAIPAYTLDSDKKRIYHIGRGITSRNAGKYRINDIVIKDKEADPELLRSNRYVSSAHADIVFKNNKYYLRAAAGGCRAAGGSPTKIVRDENATELRDTTLMYPLENGDILELGKNVLLIYTLSDEESSTNIPDKPQATNAMSIDDSF